MSGILQKVKGKSLFEELCEKFPTKVVNPFGEVLIIPSTRFKNEWKERLEAERIKTFMSNYGTQSCFMLRRKKKQTQASPVIEESPVQKVEGDKPSPVKEKKPLTPEERARVKDLYDQGICGKEIAKKLGCSIQTIGGVIRHLPKLKEKRSNDHDIVKELLSACNLLFPSHTRTCLVLLEEIRVRMAVGLSE